MQVVLENSYVNWLPKVYLQTSCAERSRALISIRVDQTRPEQRRFLRSVHSPAPTESRDRGGAAPRPVREPRFRPPASRDRGPASATGPGSGHPGPFSRLSRPAAGLSGRCFARAPPCARPTASESARPSAPGAGGRRPSPGTLQRAQR